MAFSYTAHRLQCVKLKGTKFICLINNNWIISYYLLTCNTVDFTSLFFFPTGNYNDSSVLEREIGGEKLLTF